MLNEQVLFDLADKGKFHKDEINKLIKADFLRMYHSKPLMEAYKILSKKFGKSISTIRNICN
jgi:hypothetical protein